MQAVIDAALSHARTVLLSLLLILIMGLYAYITIPKESAPDINIPILYVSMSLDGISPEDAERLLLRPMESELKSVEGVKEMRATAYQGGANVVLEFDAGFDVDVALDDVREKVDRVKPDLPEDADEPTVNEVNFSQFPVLIVTLSGNVPERSLRKLARELQDDIESLSTVLEAKLAGDREEVVELLIDPLMVESYGLDAGEVISAIGRSNLLIAAGNMDTGHGRFAIKVPGLFEDLSDILEMPLKVHENAVVRIGDVADVRRTFKDPEGYARINGETAIGLEVSKRSGENIIETIEAVREIVKAHQRYWPPHIDVTFTQDQSTEIRNQLKDLENNTLSAILLVMIVVVGALGVRSAALVGVAVPGSFLIGVLVLYAIGFTVNMVVLFALILAVGMLVDGALVVTEYADRKMGEGLSPNHAYGRAAKRMAWPITASTATTLAAFLPLVFWPGVVGEFMKYLPITLLATLTASLLMALIFIPTLGATLRTSHGRPENSKMNFTAGEHSDLLSAKGFTGAYVRLLNRALKHPVKVLMAASLCLIAAQTAYALFGNGIEFFPETEPENAVLNVHARGNLSIDERDSLIHEVEDEVLKLQNEKGEFRAIYARSQSSSQGEDQTADVIGSISLEFVDWDLRRKADDILEDLRARTAHLAGIVVEPRKQEEGPGGGKPIEIVLSSRYPELLEPNAARLLKNLEENITGLKDLEDSRQIPGIEWQLTVDRAEAARFGADITLIGNIIKMVTNGIIFSSYRPDDSDDEIDIIARFPDRYRTLDQLDRLRVQTVMGQVPIDNFVHREAVPKVGELNRHDGLRVITVKSDVQQGILPDVKVKEIQKLLTDNPNILDSEITYRFKGEDEEQKEAGAFLMKAFLVALSIMGIILVTQFNSIYSAMLILSAVVMSTIGVMLGLMIMGQPFGIVMGGIGVIALAGIVVNNNIVLIDTFDYLKTVEKDDRAAILLTGAQRLRPVLLTTVTTILGLMPMVLKMNIDFLSREVTIGAPSTQWWSQLATCIVFGLAFATILTLVVTPCALMMRTRVQNWRQRRKEKSNLRRANLK